MKYKITHRACQIQPVVNLKLFPTSKGWNPSIEHTEPENAFDHYWYMWKLPLFGETDVDRILNEAELCHKANPGHHVRLIGYDNYKQSQGANMVIYRAPL